MGDHETIEDLKEHLASQARLFEERLSAIEARWLVIHLRRVPFFSRPRIY